MCTVAECKDWLADVLSQVAKARQAHETYAVLAGKVRCARCAMPHPNYLLSLVCTRAATRHAMAAPEISAEQPVRPSRRSFLHCGRHCRKQVPLSTT